MKTSSKKDPRAWRHTPEGRENYRQVRAEAQARANQSGFDIGLEANDYLKGFRTFLLPRKVNRRGHEIMCEVVMCENLENTQSGHGPLERD